MYTYSQGLQWCIQIADGLAFLHSQRPLIIHRDIKAANVLLTEGVICNTLQPGEVDSRTGRFRRIARHCVVRVRSWQAVKVTKFIKHFC